MEIYHSTKKTWFKAIDFAIVIVIMTGIFSISLMPVDSLLYGVPLPYTETGGLTVYKNFNITNFLIDVMFWSVSYYAVSTRMRRNE